MKPDLVLRNATIVVPGGRVAGDLAVVDGRIAAIGGGDAIGAGHREIDLDGRFLLPGLVDPHTHIGIGDTISDEKMAEDFAHATRDCLIGGVTTLATTIGEGTDPLRERMDRAIASSAGGSWVDHKFTAVVGHMRDVDDIPYAVSRGAVGFKFFTGYAGEQAEEFGMDAAGITPDLFLHACRAIRAARDDGYAAIHAEEPYVREVLAAEAMGDPASAGAPLTAWMEASPEWAETVQVVLYGFVARDAGLPLYVVHVSSALTLDVIDWMRAHGADIVGETLALFLNATAEELDAAGFGAKAKIQPPVRSEADRQRLWDEVQRGSITLVGTDSLTYTKHFKETVPFWESRVGVNAQFADTLPLMWDACVNEGRLPLERMVALLSENAARRLALFPRKGAITVGADADLVVVDPELELELGVSRYRGGTDYSLWEGRKVVGGPVMTFLRGELVMQDGELVNDSPTGRYLER